MVYIHTYNGMYNKQISFLNLSENGPADSKWIHFTSPIRPRNGDDSPVDVVLCLPDVITMR